MTQREKHESRMSVLVAARQLQMFRAVERNKGAEWCFSFVSDGKQLIAQVQRKPPDLMIVDGVLPGTDGLAAVDALRELIGERLPLFIGGALLPAMREGFLQRGALTVVAVPWQCGELSAALDNAMVCLRETVDWSMLREAEQKTAESLRRLGTPEQLAGFAYLCAAAAMVSRQPRRMERIGTAVYAPVAKRFQTSASNVERLIRHAVERTMDRVTPEQLYAFFGNSIDPMRGKPTNAQMIVMLAQCRA